MREVIDNSERLIQCEPPGYSLFSLAVMSLELIRPSQCEIVPLFERQMGYLDDGRELVFFIRLGQANW